MSAYIAPGLEPIIRKVIISDKEIMKNVWRKPYLKPTSKVYRPHKSISSIPKDNNLILANNKLSLNALKSMSNVGDYALFYPYRTMLNNSGQLVAYFRDKINSDILFSRRRDGDFLKIIRVK